MPTQQLAEYIITSLDRNLPAEVSEHGLLHIIDTVAAMISGSRLVAGQKALPYVAHLGGKPECTVLASSLRASAIDAALANGMFAHADESDDSHAPSLTHPGCAVVPAALAMAERHACSATDLLRAVVLGYDIGCRMSMALGASRFADRFQLSSHAYGGVFGATAAACALARLDIAETRHALSYAVQMASGSRCWIRDPEHVQKAFVFGGMPASSGVRAATMAAAGFTGVADPLQGTAGLFTAFREECEPSRATELLGERFEVMRTTIKKWCVGSPIQAALDAIDEICDAHGITGDAVAGITVSLPSARAQVVDGTMPNVNLRHVLALYLQDAGLSFAALHDHKRLTDPRVLEYADKIELSSRAGAKRHELAELTLITKDGRRFHRAPGSVRGQPANPMTVDEVIAKAHDLMTPVLGTAGSAALVTRLRQPDSISDITELREYWQLP